MKLFDKTIEMMEVDDKLETEKNQFPEQQESLEDKQIKKFGRVLKNKTR